MSNFLNRYVDKKKIVSDLIRALIIFIVSIIYSCYYNDLEDFLKNTLSDWVYNAVSFSIQIPISALILVILLIIFIPKVINRYFSKTTTQLIPEWVITTNKTNPQWAEYKEIPLNNQNLKSINLKLKVRSDFMRFGFKFLDQNAVVLNATHGVVPNDNNILVHIGKQVGNADLSFVAFKKGEKDLEDTRFSTLNDKLELKLKIKLINKNNFKFFVNGKMIYSSYIETPLKRRLVLMSWSDTQHDYDLITENIKIVTEY